MNNKLYNICVSSYHNGRIRLRYENENEGHDISINLIDAYLENGKIFLDPIVKNNGLLKQLKKCRIIREICGSINYNYTDIPIAILNMGILRQYDYNGVSEHLEMVAHYEK